MGWQNDGRGEVSIGWSITSSGAATMNAREMAREVIKKDTEAFIKRGGAVTHIPTNYRTLHDVQEIDRRFSLYAKRDKGTRGALSYLFR
jgi:hypothetical protein